MDKFVIVFDGHQELLRLATIIIERSFPENTNVTPEMFVNEMKSLVSTRVLKGFSDCGRGGN